jgi:L-fuconolactonase
MVRIDSHQHFWQLSRGDYAWLTPELEVLYKDFLPDDLAPLLEQSQVNKTILVQAATTTAETDFMLKVASETEFVAGVVGWVDMECLNALAHIEHFSQTPYFKGIRPMIQEIEDNDWMLKPELAPVFELLIAKRLTFDALVLPQHLDALYILLKRYPALKVVIDHGGKPAIADSIANNSSSLWYEKTAKIASETTAFCKLSGLVTEAGVDPNYEQLAPYMEHLLVCFGAKRLMWGSDWPVVNLSSNYSKWTKQVETFVEALTATEQQSIWSTTAQKFYKIQ